MNDEISGGSQSAGVSGMGLSGGGGDGEGGRQFPFLIGRHFFLGAGCFSSSELSLLFFGGACLS